MKRTRHDVVALSIPFDIHTSAVKLGLLEYGIELFPIYPSSYPYDSTIDFRTSATGHAHLLVDGLPLSSDSRPFVFWARRRGQIQPLVGLDPKDEKIAADHSNRLIESLGYDLSSRSIFAINDYRSHLAAEKSKLLQLSVAARIGLESPETLITNDPDSIREFLRRADGPVIGKALGPAIWREDGATHLGATSFVSESDLPEDRLLRAAPVILQRAIPKAYEVRVNVMGSYVQAVRIDSPDPNGEDIDWRVNQKTIRISPVSLPHPIERKLVELMRSMNLVFGAIDLIVRPDGSHVFLEVNQMGQFLWIEERCPEVHVLDAFCQFLASASPDFSAPHPPRVFFPQLRSAAWDWGMNDGEGRGFCLEEFARQQALA
ncbi:hypothetical protein GCM10027431_03950 [Lysobacter rhizosphaerae]